MTIADAIRRVKEGIEEVKREAERIKPVPTPPRAPAPRREPELAPTPEVRERKERRERERVAPAPAPKPTVDWWLDPAEGQAIAQEAQRIVREQAPPTIGREYPPIGPGREFGREARIGKVRIPPFTPLPPAREFGVPRQPVPGAPPPMRVEDIPGAGWEARHREAIEAGLPVAGVKPPEFEPQIAQAPAPYTGEYIMAGLEGWAERQRRRLRGAIETERPIERIPRYFIAALQIPIDFAFTAIQQGGYIVERMFGQVGFRNMLSPEEVQREYELGRAAPRATLRAGLGLKADVYGRILEDMEPYSALYEKIGPDADPGVRDRLIDQLSRMAYSNVSSQNSAAERILADEDPDKVIAEEMDPVQEMGGQIIFDPINVIDGAVASWLFDSWKFGRYSRYWFKLSEADPGMFKFMGEVGSKKAIREFLNPLAPLRRTRARVLEATATRVVNTIAGRFARDPDGLVAALKGLSNNFDDVAKMIGIVPDSEGGKLAQKLITEGLGPERIDKLASLKGQAAAVRQLGLGMIPEEMVPFHIGEFIDEVEGVLGRAADELLHIELDKPAAGNIFAKIAGVVKKWASDVYLGLNPGYMARNITNNFSTMLVDGLADFRTMRLSQGPFIQRWAPTGKIVGSERGLGTMADVAKRSLGEETGILGAVRWLPDKGHRFAAASEDWFRMWGVRTGIEKTWKKVWKPGSDFFPGTLAKYAPEGTPPEILDDIYMVIKSSMNEEEVVTRLGLMFEAPETGGLAPRVARHSDDAVPWNTTERIQSVTDDFWEGLLTEEQYLDELGAAQEGARASDAWAKQADGLYWDVKSRSYIYGPPRDDLPKPIHFFPLDEVGDIEARLGWKGVQHPGVQNIRRKIISELRGVDWPEDELVVWNHLGDEEQVHYTQRLIQELGERGKEVLPHEAEYLEFPLEDWQLLTRSPGEAPRGPLTENAINRLTGEFRDRVRAEGIEIVDNKGIAELMELTDAEAQQLGEVLGQRRLTDWSRGLTGKREVLCLEGTAEAGTTINSLENKIALTEARVQQAEMRAGKTGGMLAASDKAQLEYNKLYLAYLRGESDEYVEFLKGLRSPFEAETLSPAEAEGLVGFADEIGEATVEELEQQGYELGARLEFLDEYARELPTTQETRRYRNFVTGEPVISPKAGQRVEWDNLLQEWEGRGVPTRTIANKRLRVDYEVVDEDVFRAVVEETWEVAAERKDIRAKLKVLDDQLEGVRARDLSAEVESTIADLERMAPPAWTPEETWDVPIREPWEGGYRAGYMEQLRADEPAVKALHEQLGEDLAGKITRGEIGPEDLARAVEDGIMSPEDAKRLADLPPGPSRAGMLIEQLEAPPSGGGLRISDAYGPQTRATEDFIRTVAEEIPPRMGEPPPPPLSDELYDSVMKWWNDEGAPSMAGAKLLTEDMAVGMTDFALLDYTQRKNLDLWFSWVMPYHYWYTRSGWNWLQRMATKPWAFNTAVRTRRMLRQMNEELPTRLQSSIPVPAPFLKDWMGGKLYFDPARLLFAPWNLPGFSLYEAFDYDDPAEAANAFGYWQWLVDKIGVRSFFYFDIPMNYLSGEKDEEYYLAPLTAGIKGITAITREYGFGKSLIPPGGINIEGGLREWAGLPRAYLTEEIYWPMRQIDFMVGEGLIDPETADEIKLHAMSLGDIEDYPELKPLWDRAYQRAAVQRAGSQSGSFLWGLGANIYPSGEEMERYVSAELAKLGYSLDRLWGEAEERFDWYDEHPELVARGDTYAYMGVKWWMYVRADGSFDKEAYLDDRDEFEASGGGAAILEGRIRKRQYWRERDDMQSLKGELRNELIEQGMGPGTKADRVFEDWWRETVEEPFYEGYEQYWTDEVGEPPFKAAPHEWLAFYEEQQAKELAQVYYDIDAEDFADEAGWIDWDAFYAARDAALDALPDEVRFSVEKRIRRSRIPEEEIMAVLEDEVYRPLADIIRMKAQEEDPDIKKAIQEEIDALEERMDDLVADAIAGSVSEIMRYHPDWTEAEQARMLGYQAPGFETWRRSRMEPRSAFENAFRTFYWGLPDAVRRITYSQDAAEKAEVPQSYLGPEFEAFRDENPKLENLADISDEQLLDWLGRIGVVGMLAQEGFAIPGQELPETLRRAYEGLEPKAELPLEEPRPVGEYPRAAETAAMRTQMEEAIASVAVSGEETKEVAVETAAATFDLPDPETQARIASANAGMDAWVAGGKEGEWTEDMEWWYGDPDSPKSNYWVLRREIFATPEENNPMGWGTMPDELRETLITTMINDAYADGTQTELGDEVFAQAFEEMQSYIDKHGEELTQAREEYIGYLAMLDPEKEELQDEYFSYPKGSQERRNLFPQLDAYWTMKREYKEQRPLMVKFYFPETAAGGAGGGGAWQRRGWGGGGGGGRRPTPTWAQFAEAAGEQAVGVLIDYWSGQATLDQADMEYLQALFAAHPYGATNFEGWLSVLQQMWQASLGGGDGYEIPMRRRPITIQPPETGGGGGYVPRPPTRVRRLRG